MTLDEAIKHAEEVADLCEDSISTYDMSDPYESHLACQNGKCAEEHRQLAEWLKELKDYKDQNGDTIYRQAAIRIASGYCHPANIAAELAKLPPVQPYTEVEIQKMQELEQAELEKAFKLGKADALKKIRAEIMSKDGLEEALEIIDKYRAESEDGE